MIDAAAFVDAIVKDMELCGHEDGRDIVTLSPVLTDLLAAWRSEDEDREDDDPAEQVEPDEDGEPICGLTYTFNGKLRCLG
jgi:hypothetical protein